MIDAGRATSTAREVAESALGRDPGPLERAQSRSHHVFVGADVVVKLIDADAHSRLDRDITLSTSLPAGLSAPVLSSGCRSTASGDIRYACLARRPGTSPGIGLAGVDRATARRWAEQAARTLQTLHAWSPDQRATAVLRESLDHGGFTGRAQLRQAIQDVRTDAVPVEILDGLAAIAAGAPEQAAASVPVHADCHWGNWLVHHGDVGALLDFEWARYGEPADDWVFLSRFSGPHRHAVLAVIADETGTPLDTLRAACEVREAAYLTSDLSLALKTSHQQHDQVSVIVRDLRALAVERSWWAGQQSR